jgi:hypothetical protein
MPANDSKMQIASRMRGDSRKAKCQTYFKTQDNTQSFAPKKKKKRQAYTYSRHCLEDFKLQVE